MDPADANFSGPSPGGPAKATGVSSGAGPLLAANQTGAGSAATFLGLSCSLIDGASRGAVLLPIYRDGEISQWHPVAQWPAAEQEVSSLSAVAGAALEKGRTVARPHSQKDGRVAADVHDIAQPIDVGSEFSGVVVVEVSDCPESRLPEVVQQLQTATAYLPLVLGDPARLQSEPSRSALEAALWLVGSSLEHDRFRGAATAVATDMAAHMGCVRAAIGFVEGKQSKVQALSHSADFGERMNLIRRISSAMDEAVDQRAPIVIPAPPGRRILGVSAHEELMREEGSKAVCTVLLTWNDDIIGAITLERDTPFENDEVATLEDTATLLGPISSSSAATIAG